MGEYIPTKVVYYLKSVFDALDKSHTGFVDIDDIIELGMKYSSRSEEMNVGLLLTELDSGGKTHIGFAGFTRLFGENFMEREFERYSREAFLLLDKEEKGYLTQEELFEAIRAVCDSITLEEVIQLIEYADELNDGKVTPEVFASIGKVCGLDFKGYVERKKTEVASDAVLLMRAEQQYSLNKKDETVAGGKRVEVSRSRCASAASSSAHSRSSSISGIPLGATGSKVSGTTGERKGSVGNAFQKRRSSSVSLSLSRTGGLLGVDWSGLEEQAKWRELEASGKDLGVDLATPYFSRETGENTRTWIEEELERRRRQKEREKREAAEREEAKRVKERSILIPGEGGVPSMFSLVPLSPSSKRATGKVERHVWEELDLDEEKGQGERAEYGMSGGGDVVSSQTIPITPAQSLSPTDFSSTFSTATFPTSSAVTFSSTPGDRRRSDSFQDPWR